MVESLKIKHYNSAQYIYMMKKLYSYQLLQINADRHSFSDVAKFIDNKEDLSVIQAEITNNIKDAEMTLKNIDLGLKSGKSSYCEHPEEVILAKCDLILHWITFYNLEIDHSKMLTFAQ